MIELVLAHFDDKSLQMLTALIMWVVQTLEDDPEYSGVKLDGYTVVRDEVKQDIFTLLVCEHENQKKILELLKQPPNLYKEKYIARIINLEPEPVYEIKESDDVKSEDEKSEET